MPLTMRPSGLASTGYYKDHADYLIFCGGWNIGRIYEIRSRPVSARSSGFTSALELDCRHRCAAVMVNRTSSSGSPRLSDGLGLPNGKSESKR